MTTTAPIPAPTAFASSLRRLITSVLTLTVASFVASVTVNAATIAKANAAPSTANPAPYCAPGDAPELRFSVFFDGDSIVLDLAGQEVVALVAEELANAEACFVDVIVDPDSRGLSWNVVAWKRAAAINAALRQAGLPKNVSLAVMARDPRQGAALVDWAPRDDEKRLEIVIRGALVTDALSYDIRD